MYILSSDVVVWFEGITLHLAINDILDRSDIFVPFLKGIFSSFSMPLESNSGITSPPKSSAYTISKDCPIDLSF